MIDWTRLTKAERRALASKLESAVTARAEQPSEDGTILVELATLHTECKPAR
jgi:hypothetical protein